MKLRKLSAIMMAAVVAASTPAGAVLGQITAYADTDKSKDYEIGGADWDVQEDANGKVHIYATWDTSDDSCSATITVRRDDKSTGISVTTTTTKGSVELTQQIKKYGKTGDYTFKIKAKSKSKDEDGKSTSDAPAESEADFLEIDSDMMKKLSSTAATSSGVSTSNGQTPGSSIPTPGTSTTPTTPSAGPSGTATSTPATQSTDTSGDFLMNGTITDWGIGHVYLVNGAPVFSKWIVDSGKLYHIGANGFMDKNIIFSDYTGTHYVGADGALVY